MSCRETIRCPTCDFPHMEPLPTQIRHVPWGSCACSDQSTCVYHQVNWEDRPERPSDVVLTERAEEMTKQALEHWATKRARLLEGK